MSRDAGDPIWFALPTMLRPGCWRKIGYPSRKAAKPHAVALRAVEPEATNITEYLCPTCMRWHVGHSSTAHAPQRRIVRTR